jgi:hypothetical protein
MKYFRTLPLVAVTQDNKTLVYRNLLSRLSVIPSVLQNPLVYYSYDVKDGETPEIVADKYYGDSYRYWIVLFSNQYLDPQWDWPLSSIALEQYIADKYESPYDVKSYQKTITQKSSVNDKIVSNTVEITQDEYNNLMESTQELSFPDETVTVSITKNIQTYYDYEVEQNEQKRNIKLLNKDYVPQLESEFEALMS